MKKTLTNLNLFSLFLFIVIFSFCSDKNVNEPPPPYEYLVPEQTNDGWETGSLDEVNIESEKLITLVDHLNFGLINNVHSVLIIKNDKLVFEEYFEGNTFDINGTNFHGSVKNYDKNTIHNQASVTKSFASALIGIAISKGFIKSVDEKVFSYFPEYSSLNIGEKQNITIEHLLTMSAGFEWNEWEVTYANLQNDLIQMWYVNDPLEYLVSKPIVSTPGTQFYYNSGCTNLLGEIVFKATGIKPDVFADQYLFSKLGIVNRTWAKFSNGVVFVSGDLKIRPRDMAKFGYLYLKNGVWNGQQVISKEWINKSTEEFIAVNNNWKYGYKWWLRNYSINGNNHFSYSARGWGGQQITVFPELDIILVFTGGNYATGDPVDMIIIDYILPSVLQ